MSIFDTINNDKFFNPFCCRNKELGAKIRVENARF
jgi:hypothetical protein